MKKIQRNAVKKNEEILKKAKKITAHTYLNDYKGEDIQLTERDIQYTIDDIKEGYASIYKINDKTHKIKYAGRCFWKVSAI